MDLVEELRNNPEAGARRLETEYKAGLLALARRLCADEGDAEELVNGTFAEVVRSIDRYAEQSAFFGWMARIMIHLNGRKNDRKSNRTVVASEEIPDAVTNGLESMGNRAFITCTSLQGFDCGESSLRKIEASMFYKDTGLGIVRLPNTVTNIDSGVFYGCTSLTNFTPLLPPALQALGNLAVNDRPLYDTAIRGHVVSPPSLTNLLSNSFRGTHIESFTSPKKGLRSIGQYAFSRCSNLTNVVLSADLESIESNWLYNVASTGSAHVWFRNLPANLPGNLWANTTKQHITIHLPWSQQDAWREWVASGPSGHTFTFNKATKTLPEHLDDVGTWLSSVTQNVTWYKDETPPTLILVK